MAVYKSELCLAKGSSERKIKMSKFQVVEHPLIQHKLSILRRKEASTKEFRELVDEIGMLMAYEVSRDLPLEESK